MKWGIGISSSLNILRRVTYDDMGDTTDSWRQARA